MFADLDCADFSKTCKVFNIKNYPTFLWIEDGEIVDAIPKECSMKTLIEYIKKKVPSRQKREAPEDPEPPATIVQEINGTDFVERIRNGITLVKFCVPGCPHCPQSLQTMVELKEEFANDPTYNFYRLDCSKPENEAICYEELDNGVPALNLYRNLEMVVDDYQGLTIEEIKDMLIGNTGNEDDLAEWKEREKERRIKRKEDRHEQRRKRSVD